MILHEDAENITAVKYLCMQFITGTLDSYTFLQELKSSCSKIMQIKPMALMFWCLH